MSHEIIFLSEINEKNLSPGQRIRTIGVVEMEPFSSIKGRIKWKDSSLRVDLEYVQSVRVLESTFYQILGEIQQDRVSCLSFSDNHVLGEWFLLS
jgi:hypothetical protein